MPWKVDDKQVPVMQDGNPVWIDDAGKEMIVQGNTISRLNGEAKTHREAKEAAEAKLKPWDGLEPADVRAKLDKFKDVDLSKMVQAGKLDEVRTEVTRQSQEKIQAAERERDALRAKHDNMLMQAAFTGSKFMQERVAIPAEMVQSTFGRHFKIEEDKIVPYDNLGSKLLSKKRMGEYADFDEAIEMFVDAYPHKDAILKAPGGTGTGGSGGGGQRPGSKFVKRSDFAALSPAQQAEAAGKMRTGELTIVD